MNLEALAESGPGRSALRALAAVMESRLRYRFFAPQQALEGAGLRPGQAVLEIGCGTGFFRLPAARVLGERGSLVAMDRLPAAVAAVAAKVSAAGLKRQVRRSPSFFYAGCRHGVLRYRSAASTRPAGTAQAPNGGELHGASHAH